MCNIKSAFAFLVLVSVCASSFAQNKPANKSQTTAVKKIKPPKLHSFLADYTDSVSVPVSEAERVIGMPLKIYDDKKTEYQVSSYQFMYKKRVVTEDEKTGKVSPANSISSDRFKITPLPELWINIVKRDVKPGEEFFFFDVIAKDAQGRVMYAPNLKIMVR